MPLFLSTPAGQALAAGQLGTQWQPELVLNRRQNPGINIPGLNDLQLSATRDRLPIRHFNGDLADDCERHSVLVCSRMCDLIAREEYRFAEALRPLDFDMPFVSDLRAVKVVRTFVVDVRHNESPPHEVRLCNSLSVHLDSLANPRIAHKPLRQHEVCCTVYRNILTRFCGLDDSVPLRWFQRKHRTASCAGNRQVTEPFCLLALPQRNSWRSNHPKSHTFLRAGDGRSPKCSLLGRTGENLPWGCDLANGDDTPMISTSFPLPDDHAIAPLRITTVDIPHDFIQRLSSSQAIVNAGITCERPIASDGLQRNKTPFGRINPSHGLGSKPSSAPCNQAISQVVVHDVCAEDGLDRMSRNASIKRSSFRFPGHCKLVAGKRHLAITNKLRRTELRFVDIENPERGLTQQFPRSLSFHQKISAKATDVLPDLRFGTDDFETCRWADCGLAFHLSSRRVWRSICCRTSEVSK